MDIDETECMVDSFTIFTFVLLTFAVLLILSCIAQSIRRCHYNIRRQRRTNRVATTPPTSSVISRPEILVLIQNPRESFELGKRMF